jgi:hypothetical protein
VVNEADVDKKREQDLYDSRSVTFYQDDQGMWIIKAKLPTEQGGLLVKLLEELGERIVTPEIKDEQDVEIKDKKPLK